MGRAKVKSFAKILKHRIQTSRMQSITEEDIGYIRSELSPDGILVKISQSKLKFKFSIVNRSKRLIVN